MSSGFGYLQTEQSTTEFRVEEGKVVLSSFQNVQIEKSSYIPSVDECHEMISPVSRTAYDSRDVKHDQGEEDEGFSAFAAT
jgi:hypothetical protein